MVIKAVQKLETVTATNWDHPGVPEFKRTLAYANAGLVYANGALAYANTVSVRKQGCSVRKWVG